MFDIGFSELALIALLALIVLGPKRLPEVARTAGRWMGKLRHFVSTVRQDLDQEMRNAEIMELHKLKEELDETRRMMQDTSSRMMQQIGGMPSTPETLGTGVGPSTSATPAAPSVTEPPRQTMRAKARVANESPAKKSRKASAARHPHGRTRKAKPRKRG